MNASRCVALLTVMACFAWHDASAAILRCDGCSTQQLRTSAKSAGSGDHYIMDLSNPALTYWHVEYVPDGSLYIATPQEVPSGVHSQFLTAMDLKAQAHQTANGHMVFTLDANNPHDPGFQGNILGPYSNYDAYDVVTNPGLRNQIGTQLANSWTGGAYSLMSIVQLVKTPFFDPIEIKIIVIWKDGSRTSFEINSSHTNQASYVRGESEDPNQQPIPDGAFTDSSTGPGFTGTYAFGSTDDINDWINAAALMGIPITGGSHGLRLSCTWVNTTLTCTRLNQ